MKKMTIAGIGVMGLLITGYAEKVDILKPEYQRKELAVKKLINVLAQKGIS